MTPRTFVDEIAHANCARYLGSKNNLRLAINAVLTLDAALDVLYAGLKHANDASVTRFADAGAYKESIAATNTAYGTIRGLADALRRGDLEAKAGRLVRQDPPANARFGKLMANRSGFNSRAVAIEADGHPPQAADEIILDVDMLLSSLLLRHGM